MERTAKRGEIRANIDKGGSGQKEANKEVNLQNIVVQLIQQQLQKNHSFWIVAHNKNLMNTLFKNHENQGYIRNIHDSIS